MVSTLRLHEAANMGETDHTLLLAEFLSYLKYNDLPPEVILQAKKSILNVLGCGIGYVRHGPAEKAFAMIQGGRGCDEASILGRNERASVENASLINGIAMTTADFDDTHLRTVNHPSGTSVAALLSWAETNHMTGKDFLLAFVCGLEVQCAVANTVVPAHYRDGWHITGTTGSFAAAAAIAKAKKLVPQEFAAALSHSASMAAGIRAMFGTDTKTLHMGRGAQNGLLAANLASHGFGSCPRAIESWARLASSTVQENCLTALTRGESYQILENTFKPYPCGIVVHPLIDAGLEARAALQEAHGTVNAGEIQSIDATVNPQCVRLCNVRHPTTGLETIFSLHHGIASALLYGQAGPKQFSDRGCQDEPSKQLRDKVRVSVDDKVADDAARLKITFAGGKEHEVFIEHATGSLTKPMTSKQLENKFADLADGVLGAQRVREVIDKGWRLDAVADMGEFVRLLVPP